jgi:aminoglycoside phosphotransferase (APT) family kinase protein
MALGNLRDLDALADGLTRWLAARRPGRPVAGVSLSHAAAGLSNETVLVTVSYESGDDEGLVVRVPPVVPSFPSYDLAMQAAVHHAAAAAGVPAPVPTVVETDPSFIGTEFLTMPFIAGHVPSQAPAFDEWIVGATPDRQRALHDGFIGVLSAIHRIDPDAGRLRDRLANPGGRLDDEVARWAGYLDWAFDGSPPEALASAHGWCAANRPAEALPPVVCWGDARLGNVIFDDDRRPVAVLDWEMALVGPAEIDLGWYLAQARAMEELLGRTVPGFPNRAGVIASYAAAAGRSVGDMGWFEVFGLFRQVAVFDRQALLAERSGAAPPVARGPQNPLVALLGRVIDEADEDRGDPEREGDPGDPGTRKLPATAPPNDGTSP